MCLACTDCFPPLTLCSLGGGSGWESCQAGGCIPTRSPYSRARGIYWQLPALYFILYANQPVTWQSGLSSHWKRRFRRMRLRLSSLPCIVIFARMPWAPAKRFQELNSIWSLTLLDSTVIKHINLMQLNYWQRTTICDLLTNFKYMKAWSYKIAQLLNVWCYLRARWRCFAHTGKRLRTIAYQ